MSDYHSLRSEMVVQRLKPSGIEALLVSSPTNVGYLTGFTGEASTLLLLHRGVVLLSDGRFAQQVERECPGLETYIRPVGQLMPAAVAEVAGKLGIRQLALEAN